ncbi:MAG: hypothetical protein HC944_04130, partial [Nanoarchaeota archaeon]|nr:hypothetical protein [Nanoarchaeota archaeon]
MNKKKDKEDENIASKRNDDWWRLEKFQIGRKKYLRLIIVMGYAYCI